MQCSTVITIFGKRIQSFQRVIFRVAACDQGCIIADGGNAIGVQFVISDNIIVDTLGMQPRNQMTVGLKMSQSRTA